VAGLLMYPIPLKIVQPGNIVAYGYEGETVFLTMITPPKELKGGETVSLKGNVSWLCCKEECMPGHRGVEISLPVGEQAGPANGDMFEKAQAAMPVDSPPADVVNSTKVETAKGADGDTFTLRIAWKQPVTKVDMFPTNVTGLDVSAITVATVGNETQVSFKGRVMAGQKLAVEEMSVLIVYTDVDGRQRGFYTQVNLGDLSSDIH
jgi:DsbC/DsbD-like thiol-disulfide interchange protein